jgi:CubicO group peptidase (beta-lactamase class C family)
MIRFSKLTILAAAIALSPGLSPADDDRRPFRSPSTVDETRRQIEALPKDDVWWTVNGPDMAWNNKNLQRFLPTVSVYRDGPVRELKYRLDPRIAGYEIDTPDGPMPYRDFLDSDLVTTMGMVILHEGDIVFERYPRMKEHEKPLYWSVTKVFVSALVGILEDRGLVDVSKPVETYVPELSGSSFAGIRVRNILDMANGLDCPEEYEDRSSCYYRFAVTIGDGFWDESSPDNPYEMLAALDVDRVAEQGTAFAYSGVNTFVLGWLVEKITGMPFQDALSREIWSRMGAEGDGLIFAPRFGVPVIDGGLMARLRDVARFGLLHTPSYTVVSDERIISERYVELIRNGGNPALLEKARAQGWVDNSVKHSVYQWDLVFDNNDFYKGGWAGQGLLVNPDRDLVAVWPGYFKDDEHSEIPPLPVLRTVLNGVFGKD